jgi:regulator of protease activity HflC (stomatin/prohibitin superfamily)
MAIEIGEALAGTAPHSRRLAALGTLVVLLLLYVRKCWATVNTSEMAIVERFGKFSHIASPGLHMIWAPFYRIAGRLSTRVQQLNVKTDTKTKDNVTVDLTIAVQYRVIDREMPPSTDGEAQSTTMPTPQTSAGDDAGGLERHGVWRAFYRLTGIEYQLRAYVEDVVRSELPLKTLDEAYETKDAVAVAVRRSLQTDMKWYGYEVLNALVTDLQPNRKVVDAMNQINAERRLRLAAEEKAEGQKVLVIKAAEADAEAKHLAGIGLAKRRSAIISGLKESVKEFCDEVNGTTPTEAMTLIMQNQHLDMLKGKSLSLLSLTKLNLIQSHLTMDPSRSPPRRSKIRGASVSQMTVLVLFPVFEHVERHLACSLTYLCVVHVNCWQRSDQLARPCLCRTRQARCRPSQMSSGTA